MKRRCMCGKPDTMEYGIWQDIEYDNLLHFKSADRECERCGRPLCEDCQVQQLKTKGIKQTSLHFTWFEAEYVTRCSVCAEEVA